MSRDSFTDPAEQLLHAEAKAYRLLQKFHIETNCGEDGNHWAECDALVDAFGWESWEAWVAAPK